ncbi:MAG: hypothetical protein H6806_03835 [Planctomycetes bacterium]|nr:hypothetical protein [Planctomycetota bacterium]
MPTWNESDIDICYWYYATLAMFRSRCKHWDGWKTAMESAMVEPAQGRRFRQFKGSWDGRAVGPDGGRVWHRHRGHVLQAYYRYDRVPGTRFRAFERDRREEPTPSPG